MWWSYKNTACFRVIDLSFYGVLVFFHTDWLSILHINEGMHLSLLMGFVGAFFNRLLYFPKSSGVLRLLSARNKGINKI